MAYNLKFLSEVKLVFISSSSLGFERGKCQFPPFMFYSPTESQLVHYLSYIPLFYGFFDVLLLSIITKIGLYQSQIHL